MASASNGKRAVTGRGAGCVDKVVEPVDDLTRFGSGNKICRDPLTNVARSRRGHAAITSGANQKAGPASHVGSIHGLGRCGHRDEDDGESDSDVTEHDHLPGSRGPKFIVHLEAATRRVWTKRWRKSCLGISDHGCAGDPDYDDHQSERLCGEKDLRNRRVDLDQRGLMPPHGSIAVLSTKRKNQAQAGHQDVGNHGFSQAWFSMSVQRHAKQKVSPTVIGCLLFLNQIAPDTWELQFFTK
jgi:hypothetical protein